MKTCPVCDTDYPDQHNTCPTDGAVLIVSHELAVGSLVKNKYKIVKMLGQGGMGVVYLAEHMMLGGHVALKFLVAGLSHNPQFIKRFRNEAQAAFSLRHPNIVQVLDLDQTEDGSLFIAMEYVAGNSLRGALDEEPNGFGVPRAIEMARGMVSGLAAAHVQGIVHRDVKPENVLLARTTDGREQPKVLDFGIAAMAKSSTQSNMTRGRLLTAEYAAPEQWMEMPAAEMDGRTDLYALGCVFYEMLTGSTPFHAHSLDGWSQQHQMEKPRLPSEQRPELANWPGLDGLVMRMLAKNRNDRPQDAEVLSLLDAECSGPIQKRRETAAGYAQEHAQTIFEDSWARQQVAAPVPQLVLPPEKREEQKFPGWAWGALAVLALAAGLTMAWLFSPKPHPVYTIATTNPSAVVPPLQTALNTSTATPNKPTDLTEPAPESNRGDTSAINKSAGTPDKNSSQVNNAKAKDNSTPFIPPPVVKQTVKEPSLSDITQQALALYNQKHFSDAGPLLDKACTGGNGEACKDLGNMYHDGNGAPKDGLRAASFYSMACDVHYALGCTNLGVMYHIGDSVAQNDVRAADLYSKACDAGDGVGCANLGNSYWNGKGVSQDDTRAAMLYSRACDTGNGAACSNLGHCYFLGRGVIKDTDKARQLLTKGCGLGNKWGCDRLKEMK
ncbi:MAG: serine/threonine-protein kinase [Terracidiphilus sp.]|jgi:serine/threonine-protein kinase